MSKSLAEALSPLAARMPRPVREYEVLRVAGVLMGDDTQASARNAAAEVLRWATKQVGTQLPKEAWEGESFDLPLPGRDPSAIRLTTESADLWAFRLHRPDRDIPGRAWTTEVVIGHVPGQPVRLSVRLLAASDEPVLAITPAVPGFVRQIAQKCGLIVGSQRATPNPAEFHTREDAELLIEHLVDPGRVLPTVVLTHFEGNQAPAIDPRLLNGTTLGLAHIVVAHNDACWALTEQVGKRLSVFGGAARVYQPGFDHAADPFAHRLVLGEALRSREGAERSIRWLRETSAQSSLHRTRLGKDVLTFMAVRGSSLEAQQATLLETASEARQLIAAQEQIKLLKDQIASVRGENEYYIQEYERERYRAETAEGQYQGATWRIQQLTEKLRKVGDEPDDGMGLPTSWDGFVEWTENQFAGRLVLTPSARRAVRKPEFEDVELAARCICWLASEARDRFINGGGKLANISIFESVLNAPCGADSYDFDWAGRRLSGDWHIERWKHARPNSLLAYLLYV